MAAEGEVVAAEDLAEVEQAVNHVNINSDDDHAIINMANASLKLLH